VHLDAGAHRPVTATGARVRRRSVPPLRDGSATRFATIGTALVEAMRAGLAFCNRFWHG